MHCLTCPAWVKDDLCEFSPHRELCVEINDREKSHRVITLVSHKRVSPGMRRTIRIRTDDIAVALLQYRKPAELAATGDAIPSFRGIGSKVVGEQCSIGWPKPRRPQVIATLDQLFGLGRNSSKVEAAAWENRGELTKRTSVFGGSNFEDRKSISGTSISGLVRAVETEIERKPFELTENVPRFFPETGIAAVDIPKKVKRLLAMRTHGSPMRRRPSLPMARAISGAAAKW